MTTSYLERFRSGLREVQSNQIMRLIALEKRRGAITTVDEFKNRLSELTAKLSGTRITPTLEVYLGNIGDVIDSETFNFMLARIEDDLATAFDEMNTIDEVLDAHETIVYDVVLRNLELALDDLESKLESFEFINNSLLGFDNAIFNTFRITQEGRGSTADVTFIDPKTLVRNTAENNALIDFIGEKLLLGTSLSEEVEVQSIRQIFDSESTGSEFNIAVRGSDINNIIDSKVGSFWVQSIALSAPRGEEGVVTKLEIDLGTVRTINTLQLEPIINFPVELIGIDYIDANNDLKSILVNPVDIRSTNKLLFNTIATEKLILRFRNRNYVLSQYEEKPNGVLPTITRDLADFNDSINSSLQNFQELVSSPRLYDALGLDESEGTKRAIYEYLIGFDNIKIGLNEFNEVSIYTSKTETIDKLGSLALKVHEKRPVGNVTATTVEYTQDTHPLSYDPFYHASAEYYFFKSDYRANGGLLQNYLLPILPLGQERVRHERLYLTEASPEATTTNDVGYLQFFTLHDPYHATNAPDGDIRVYRNGQELISKDAEPLAVSDWWIKDTDFSLDTPSQGLPMKYAIRISNPNPNNIYTVSYTPALSTSDQFVPEATSLQYLVKEGIKFVDLAGDMSAWLGKDNILRFKTTYKGTEIAYSTINLLIVLRRNSANVNLTSVVDDYLIATGKINTSKFR